MEPPKPRLEAMGVVDMLVEPDFACVLTESGNSWRSTIA
jgi:hypothetical protein